ncbi:hypothetical protein GWO43_19135, partial [candidate division KSB1 bacterium]|nr:hypothetical protein [candidate division KSB1 bacterium]NIR71225.1 hypothetical protein [candidate division KSB1 bacterium]NIS27599.1 hypothetical protein [candidate division KSB1 bacterium]NIT72950.1 hypothetical protein [candidate division KSB1 bacterium]NIU28315.1 hypothetical protein [candidate division KSB1 bacterium]
MKIAITADVHLTSRKLHPERYHALENILDQMLQEEITTLIVAGDLFDESSRNYDEFDTFCKSSKYSKNKFILIPGNHDVRLNKEFVTAENVEIITEPTVRSFESKGLKLFLLPYKPDKSMGEFIAEKSTELPENDWVLIGHGDWAEGMREPNPFEPGVYMPLTRTDMETYKPEKVILGHIHKCLDRDKIHYIGSPCGLDITETGRRRFLILDSKTGRLTPKGIDSDYIYFNESFIILPLKNEKTYVKQQIAS